MEMEIDPSNEAPRSLRFMLNFKSSFGRAFSNRAFTGAAIFVLFLYLLEEFIFGFPLFRLYQITMIFRPPGERLAIIVSGIASFLFCFGFAWVALASPRPLQIVFALLISLSSLIQFGFWKAVGRFMSTVDLQIAKSTPFSTWQGAGAIYFDRRFVLPILGFIVCLALFGGGVKEWRLSLVKSGALLAALLLLGLWHALSAHTLDSGPSVSSFHQTIARFTFEEMMPSDREAVALLSPETPRNNIVLVIDESIRGDHMSINGYPRATTPFLDSLAGENILRNWGLAVAGATCSHPSNSLILTGVRPGVDEFDLIKKYPTVFQYAKAMGYKTMYIDAQTNSFWNGLTEDDVLYLDQWIKVRDLGDDIQSDFRAAEFIFETVSGGTGYFVVLNKRGVHFLYEGSYPAEAEIWTPVPGEYTRQPDLVVNPYDNGVRYNVNTFFERLLPDLHILDSTTILYTSDHGQTLFEGGVSWLHCNYKSAEATVPLIMFGRDLPVVDAEDYSASHSNILPTLLDLLGVPQEQRLHSYAPSLFSATIDNEASHIFLNGALHPVEFAKP